MTGGRPSRVRAAGAPAPSRSQPGAVALLLDRVARARVVDALRPHSGVVFVDTADAVIARVSSAPASLVILECRDREGRSTVATVQALREGYPSVPIIAYTAPGRTSSSEILAMARAGVHELVMQGFDDVGAALRTVTDSAMRRCATARVLAALDADLPPGAVPFIQYCLEHASRSPTVTGAALHLGVHRKTLVYRLKRTTLPPPSAMIGWCRLFVAAHMLEDPSRSVAQVALALDFSSSAALRGMLRRYTGRRPQEVREQGGLSALLDCFRAVLRPRPLSA